MKKLVVLFMAMLTVLCVSFGTITVFAETPEVTTEATTPEVNLPTTDEVIDNMTSGTEITEEDKQLIKDLVEKVKGYTSQSDSFFIKFIVPLIVAGVLCLLIGLIVLLPWFKAKAETTTVKKMLKNAKEQITLLKGALEDAKKLIDLDELEKSIEKFMTKEMQTFITLIQETLTRNGIEISKTQAVLLALKDGAINAWKGSPEAVNCLTRNADSKMLDDVIKENAKLKAYITYNSGEKAIKEAVK